VQETQHNWVKSSFSTGMGACVALARVGGDVALRNTRDPGVILQFTQDEIAAFIDGARNGDFDHLIDRPI
jgi:Domain of unknown function (DUF397)